MEFLGLHYAIWIVLVLYFAGMLLMGWWSKKGIHNQEGYLLGNRQFGIAMMTMQASLTGIQRASTRNSNRQRCTGATGD